MSQVVALHGSYLKSLQQEGRPDRSGALRGKVLVTSRPLSASSQHQMAAIDIIRSCGYAIHFTVSLVLTHPAVINQAHPARGRLGSDMLSSNRNSSQPKKIKLARSEDPQRWTLAEG